jgi:5-(aminomethyl)-3-furanmethanol phosphate kinase
MTSPLTRIVKVGGSLFDLPDLGARLHAWLDVQPQAVNVLLAGGGVAVDQIRAEAVHLNLSESEAHWRCVDVMTSTANQLSQALPKTQTQTHISFTSVRRPTIFLCSTWLLQLEPITPGTILPESWDVTSDSIAARLAICIGADELVLLKSADPPSSDLQALADIGYIDKFFPKLAGELPPCRMVNLRM